MSKPILARPLLLACDPGVTGAVALFDIVSSELLFADDIPIIYDKKTKWVDAVALSNTLAMQFRGRLAHAVVERVHAMPTNGVVAAFSQGSTLASLLSTLQIMDTSIELITPGRWKADIGLTHPKETSDRERKEAARNKARLLYPKAPLDRVKDHGRAEAILIGHWYLTTRARPAAA